MKVEIHNYIKNSMILRCISLLLLLSGNNYISLGQEQIDFGQYMLFKPIINSAASAQYESPVLSIYGRMQWTSIEGAPRSIGSHFIYPFSRNSLGLSLKQESIGVHSKQIILGYYTHKIHVTNKDYLSFGLGLGAESISSKFSDANNPNNTDLSFSNNTSAIGPEMTFGIYYFNEKIFFGFSLPSLIKNRFSLAEGSVTSESDLDSKYWDYNILGGYSFILDTYMNLDLSSLAKLSSNTPAEIDLNAQLKYKKIFGVGFSYRTKRELLFLINYQFQQRYKLGYSYHNYFGVNGHILSGHELIFIFELNKRNRSTIQRPRF